MIITTGIILTKNGKDTKAEMSNFEDRPNDSVIDTLHDLTSLETDDAQSFDILEEETKQRNYTTYESGGFVRPNLPSPGYRNHGLGIIISDQNNNQKRVFKKLENISSGFVNLPYDTDFQTTRKVLDTLKSNPKLLENTSLTLSDIEEANGEAFNRNLMFATKEWLSMEDIDHDFTSHNIDQRVIPYWHLYGIFKKHFTFGKGLNEISNLYPDPLLVDSLFCGNSVPGYENIAGSISRVFWTSNNTLVLGKIKFSDSLGTIPDSDIQFQQQYVQSAQVNSALEWAIFFAIINHSLESYSQNEYFKLPDRHLSYTKDGSEIQVSGVSKYGLLINISLKYKTLDYWVFDLEKVGKEVFGKLRIDTLKDDLFKNTSPYETTGSFVLKDVLLEQIDKIYQDYPNVDQYDQRKELVNGWLSIYGDGDYFRSEIDSFISQLDRTYVKNHSSNDPANDSIYVEKFDDKPVPKKRNSTRSRTSSRVVKDGSRSRVASKKEHVEKPADKENESNHTSGFWDRVGNKEKENISGEPIFGDQLTIDDVFSPEELNGGI